MITLPLLLLLTLGTQQASAGLDPITRAVQRAHSSTVALNSIDSYLVSVEDALIDAEMALEGYPPPPKRDLWTEQKIAERKAAGIETSNAAGRETLTVFFSSKPQSTADLATG
jgi:hypothetical protein